MFNKKIHLKFSVPVLNLNIEHSLPLAGFRNVCGGMMIYILNLENLVSKISPKKPDKRLTMVLVLQCSGVEFPSSKN